MSPNYALNDPLVFTDPTGEIPLGLVRRISKFVLKLSKTRSVDAAMEAVTGGIREDFGTVIDSEASFGDRALAAGSLVLELFSPVTGRDAKAAGNAIGFGKSADNVGDAAKWDELYSEATLKAFQNQLQQHGRSSLLKSQSKIQKRLSEHLTKLDEIKKAGGYTSSVEREIKTFRSQLQAIDDLLK